MVGAGSSSSGLKEKVIYAMKVTETVTLEQYDARAEHDWPKKVPNVDSPFVIDRLGDCIYDYATDVKGRPTQRKGVHDAGNCATDLNGKSVLVSDHFYYFGINAIELPKHLKVIVHHTQGHKSNANSDKFHEFVNWIEGLGLLKGQLYGWPSTTVDWDENGSCTSCRPRQVASEQDETRQFEH